MKKLLKEYVDACELIKETEKDLLKLNKKRKTTVQTSVKGSNPNYPYEEKHFHVEGIAFSYNDDLRLRCEERLLEKRKENAERIKRQVDEAVNRAPVRIQRIIRLKYFEGLSWQQVSERMGKHTTADSVRMEMERFFNQK